MKLLSGTFGRAALFVFLILTIAACGGSSGSSILGDGQGESSTGLKIFVTAAYHSGNFAFDPELTGTNAIEKADDFCNKDPNKPDSAVYKALIVDGALRDAVTLTDWVLVANTTYYRPHDNVVIDTTTSAAIFPVAFSPMENPIADCGNICGAGDNVWTGIDKAEDFSAGNDCSDWSSTSGSGKSGGYGAGSAWSFNGFGGACTNMQGLYCVEQPAP
jgi:hypothetical protein